MGKWNYRVVRTPTPDDREPYHTYAIHEAYYPDDGDKPQSITVRAIDTTFDSLDDLRDALIRMLLGTTKEVLDYDAF